MASQFFSPRVLLLLLLIGTISCNSATSNRNPVGETFPAVTGNPLSGGSIRVPADLQIEGRPIILLVGYVMKAQFDLDRWLIGLVQTRVSVKFYELPTIEGMIPGLFSGSIDRGMQSGIPDQDEATVITVYDADGSDQLIALTGNTNPRNARVLLLDRSGNIVWFHDSGFSATVLADLLTEISQLPGVK